MNKALLVNTTFARIATSVCAAESAPTRSHLSRSGTVFRPHAGDAQRKVANEQDRAPVGSQLTSSQPPHRGVCPTKDRCPKIYSTVLWSIRCPNPSCFDLMAQCDHGHACAHMHGHGGPSRTLLSDDINRATAEAPQCELANILLQTTQQCHSSATGDACA